MPSKITFITRHYPPNPNINGESVSDMVKYFEEQYHIESNVLCIKRNFEGGGMNRQPAGHVLAQRTPYQGNNAIFRFIAFLYDGYVLCRKARHHKDTLLVCTTSPPLLPLWASLFFKKNRWALWAFDLFPEGFAVTGQIRTSNPLYRWVLRKTYRGRPAFLIALGPKQAAYLARQYQRSIPTYILPCGILFYQQKSMALPEWKQDDKIYLGYCGKLDDPHNPELVKAVIDELDPGRHRLVLAVYGNRAEELKRHAVGKPGVIIVDRVPRDQLHFIDIHLVTLRTEWTHIAVPSKAVSAVSLGRPILFCGSPESDNWHLLQKAAWYVPESNIQAEVKTLLQRITKTDIEQKKSQAEMINLELQDIFLKSYQAIAMQASTPSDTGTSALV